MFWIVTGRSIDDSGASASTPIGNQDPLVLGQELGRTLTLLCVDHGRIVSLPPVAGVTTRPYRHRFPIFLLMPTIRHASELFTPRAIRRACSSRFAVSGGTPGRLWAIATPERLERCDDH